MTGFLNGVYLDPDLERGELWVVSRKSGTKHLFRVGERESLCQRQGVNYSNDGRPTSGRGNKNYRPFNGWNDSMLQDWCQNCVDAYGKEKYQEYLNETT